MFKISVLMLDKKSMQLLKDKKADDDASVDEFISFSNLSDALVYHSSLKLNQESGD